MTVATMAQDRDLVRDAILREGLHLEGGVSASKRTTGWILDVKAITLAPETSAPCARLITSLTSTFDADAVAGPALSGAPLVSAVILHSERPIAGLLIRKERKGRGLRRVVEGPTLDKGSRAVLVDDILNSGQTALWAIEALRAIGVTVVGLAVLVDFKKSGHDLLTRMNLPVKSIFTNSDLGLLRPTVQPQSRRPDNQLLVDASQIKTALPPACGSALWAATRYGVFFCGAGPSDSWSRPLLGLTPQIGTSGTPNAVWSRSGLVARFDSAGTLKWSLDAPPGTTTYDVITSQKHVFVARREAEGMTEVRAYDGDTGALVWKIHLTGRPSALSMSPDSTLLAVATDTGECFALAASTGDVLWRRGLDGLAVNLLPCLSVDGWGYGTRKGYTGVISVDGTVCWQRETGAKTQVYSVDDVLMSRKGSRLTALETRTGLVRWTLSLAAGGPWSIIAGGNKMTTIAVSARGSLLELETATGDLLGRSLIDRGVTSAHSWAVGSRLAIAYQDGIQLRVLLQEAASDF